jgi:enoyl-CoA hydratase
LKSGSLVAFEIRERVAVLRLRRPPVNAINLALVESLGEAVERATADDSDAVVVTGDRGAFSAGLDTREVPAYDAETRGRMLRGANRTVLALYGLAKPTVAAISGHALGAGLMLAVCCDVRIAAAGPFRLGLPEVDAGIPFPAAPLVVLQTEVSSERARRLALTGEVAGPDSPLMAGIVDRVVDPDVLESEALRTAKDLAAKPAYRAVKRQLREPALARIRAIVDRDEEPLLTRWI